MQHWYRQRERARVAWRADPALCYQCGQKRADDRKACASCRAKENRRRKEQLQKQRQQQPANQSAQNRQRRTQAILAAGQTPTNLSSAATGPAPQHAPPAPQPDLFDPLSSPAPNPSPPIDPPQPDRAPPAQSGPPAWRRRPGESAPAYRAFLVYLHLGLDRSLQKAYRRFKQSETANLPGRWRTWCVEHEWVARAQEYDRRQLRILEQDALQAQKASRSKRMRAAEQPQPQPKRSAAASNAARRAYQLNWRRWHVEGRLCRGLTRAGTACKRLAVPGELYCHAHTQQALQDLAPGVLFYFNANLHVDDEDLLQPGPHDLPMPQRTPPDASALLWFPRPKNGLPARLLYANDCPAALRSAIRLYAQKYARAAGLRLQVEPPRRPTQNQ